MVTAAPADPVPPAYANSARCDGSVSWVARPFRVRTSRAYAARVGPGDFDTLLAAARRNEGRSREELYRRFAPGVAAYVRRQGLDDPAGTTNDVFVRVLTHLDTFDGDARSFRSWLFVIAHSLVVDERRRKRRLDAYAGATGILRETVAGDVEEEAVEALSGSDVDRLLAGLSADQRDVLLLRVVADLPVERVADILGKQPGAIRALQHRALATLRRQLGGTLPAELVTNGAGA